MFHPATNPGTPLLFLQGIVNHGVADLVAASERLLSSEHSGTRKKVVNILVEAFQNLRHDAPHFEGNNFAGLWFENDHYQIATGNVVTNEIRNELERTMEKLNDADDDDLRHMRGSILQYPAKQTGCGLVRREGGLVRREGGLVRRGGGLGLLTMRQRSKLPLNFEWAEAGKLHSYFYLSVLIPTGAKRS